MRGTYVLVLLLLDALLLAINAQSRTFQEACIEPNRTIVLATAARKCPCRLKALLVSREPTPNLSASVYSLPSEDFEEWLSAAREARRLGHPLPNVPGNRVGIASFIDTHASTGYYGWESGDISVTGSPDRDYVAIVVATGVVERSCFLSSVAFEWQPSTCPLRFDQDIATRVVGGSVVDIENETGKRFAAYNALVRTNKGRCSASVISRFWLMTAAHCQVDQGATAYVGGQRLTDGERRTIERVVAHPDFKMEINRTGRSISSVRIVNDIALIKLTRPVSSVHSVALNINSTGPPASTVVRATGYGKKTTSTMSQRLRMVDLTLLDTQECRRRFTKAGRRDIARGLNGDINVCVGGDEQCQGGVCFGDSGGPVVARNVDGELVQVGIVSYGDSICASPDSADVYVRVSEYINWIQNVTGGVVKVGRWGTPGRIEGKEEEIFDRTLPLWSILAIAIGALVVALALVLLMYRSRRSRVEEPESDDDVERGVHHNSESNSRSSSEVNQSQAPNIIVETEDRERNSSENQDEICAVEQNSSINEARGSINPHDLD